MHRGAQLQHLVTGEIGVEYRLVRKETNQALGLDAILEGVTTIDGEPSLRRFEDAHQEAEKRRLTSAVGAEQAADLSGRDGERDVLQSDLIAECLGDSFDFNQIREGLITREHVGDLRIQQDAGHTYRRKDRSLWSRLRNGLDRSHG